MSDSSESIPPLPLAPPTAQMPLGEPTDAPPTAQYVSSAIPNDGFPNGGFPNGGFAAGPGYPPPGAGFGPYGFPYPMAQQLPRGLAITGMVLGIVGLCTSVFYIGGVVGIIGLIFSIIAIRKANRGLAGGKGMAIAGLVTSIVGIILNAIEIAVIVWFVHTVTNCNQYDTTPDPNTGVSQYSQCVRQGILGN